MCSTDSAVKHICLYVCISQVMDVVTMVCGQQDHAHWLTTVGRLDDVWLTGRQKNESV